MTTVMQNGKKAARRLEKLPILYVVGMWARYGVRPYRNSCRTDRYGMPLVWEYYDGNGTCDEWHLVPVTDTTTGWVMAWSTNEGYAQRLADAMNAANEGAMFYKGFSGRILCNVRDKILYGKAYDGTHLISFESTSAREIEREFFKAVDTYIEENHLADNVTPFTKIKYALSEATSEACKATSELQRFADAHKGGKES